MISSKEKIFILQRLLVDKLPELVDALKIRLMQYANYFVGECPIHGGDNRSALNIYLNGEVFGGNWNCYTRHCEQHFKPTILGFIRGVLSHQKHNWESPKDKSVTWQETQTWACDFLKVKFDNLSAQMIEGEKPVLQRRVEVVESDKLTTRGELRGRLIIPAQYMLGRGFDRKILDKYDVGFCNNPKKSMYKRVVVPIYDNGYNYIVGCSGRSIYERCGRCNCYHHGDCPPEKIRLVYSKWKHSRFSRASSLYNYWFAKKEIRNRKSVIICEGPGDIWKLEQANIHNAVGIYGVNLSEEQVIMLEQSGALVVFIGLNNKDKDIAAAEAIPKIKKRLARAFKLVELPLGDFKDFGDASTQFIDEEIKPLVLK